ncbi:MAG: efflux RND transporter periplasmic adaptor subunit [Prosthecobacter sp.]
MSESRPSAILRLSVFVIITAIVAAGGWWFWMRSQTATAAAGGPGKKGVMQVEVTKVGRDDYALDLTAIGTVRAFESIDISPNVTEAVTGLFFDDGDFVKQGTLLATLSDAEEQAMLASAKATLAEEEREVERLGKLVESGAAPEARLQERQTLADIAKQKIIEAQAKLADRRISAPFDGWLGLRRISVGALVSPGTVITALDKIDVVKVDFSVPETSLGSVKPGFTKILAMAATHGSKEFAGTLAQMDTRIDPVTRSVAARAEVPNPDLLLKPGMLVTVKLSLDPNVSLSIPERALVPIGQKKYVFTLAGEKAKRVEVEIGRRKPGYVEILKGLKEGQMIITDGLVGLLDGAAVKVSADFKEPSPAFNPEEDR